MSKLKCITRISHKRNPEKGERGAISRITDWAEGVVYCSGASGETFADIVYYGGLYYRCTTTHTSTSNTNPYTSIQAGSKLWTTESNFALIATKVAFVGEGADGWIIENGIIRHTSGTIELSADGTIKAGPNSEFMVTPEGVLSASAGTFDGYVRTRFIHISNSDAQKGIFFTDNGSQSVGVNGYKPVNNLNLIVNGECNIILPHDEKYVGSTITIYANNYPPYTRTGIALLGNGVTVYCGARGPFLRQYAVETVDEALNMEINPDSYVEEYSVNWVAGIKRFLGVPHTADGGTRWVVYDH